MEERRRFAVLFVLTMTVTGVWADDAIPLAATKLALPNGDFTVGRLIDSDQPDSLRWQGDGFVTPFEFSLSNVISIQFPSRERRPVSAGNYCFELAGGDLLFGKLLGLSDETAELDLPLFGRTQLARSRIRFIHAWGDGANLLYLGPNGLADWDISSPATAWREESGHLTTDQAGALIHKDFKLPARAAIELEISWTSKPDFALALGVEGGNLPSVAHAFRFEVWQNDLVAMRETNDAADVASLQRIEDGPGRLHVIAYLDQSQQRMLVTSPAGNKLADLHVADRKSFVYPRIRLTNNLGNIRLERLRINRWNGDAPLELQTNKPRLHRLDGSIVHGYLRTFDSAKNEFVVAGDAGETRIAAADAGSIELSAAESSGQSALAVLRDGTRLSGQLVGVQGGKVLLRYPGIQRLLAIPVSELQSLLSLVTQPMSRPQEGLSGQLLLAGANLKGILLAGTEGPDASCLVWQPQASTTASPLVPRIASRIIYRQPPPPPPPPPPKKPRLVPPANRGLIAAFLNGLAPTGELTQGTVLPSRGLHLRTGDTIPCEVIAIDEKGVTFKAEMTAATFVPHDKIKAVGLNDSRSLMNVDKAKQERLLTLPRMQRNNPPTHLIRSIHGDYLRARVESLDKEFLSVEVRLESKRIQRSTIAEIIWLHPDELSDKTEPRQQESLAPTRVQALRSNGTRLTFQPQTCDGKFLAGTSDVLGRCHVELADVDILLTGKQVEDTASQLAYGRWRLRHAVDPKFVTADGTTERPLGTESDMVGKPAPDFTLELLDGKPFQLSHYKGKVVILDFWATWCGPCIQVMPQIDEVVQEFKDQDVALVAVNLQEDPAVIRSTLKRLKLDPLVALDIDGVVAGRYAATAIPQTVIIDRHGNVARLFIGGGPDFAGQFRDSLQDVVGGEPSEDTKVVPRSQK